MSQCLVLGAGIVGVSTAIWLQRSGHEVVLIDREGPAAGASHGNAGMLASASLVPVTTPGLWKKVPKMLFDPDGPLFVRWSGALRMVPFLTRYLQHCRTSHVQYYAEKMGPLIYDSLAQHRALAQDTIAMEYIKEADYCFGYDHEYQWAQDQKGWDLRQQAGIRFETLSGQEYDAHDPIFSGCFAKVVRCVDHGMITDPPAYVRALAEHFVEQGGTLLIKDVTEVDIKTGPRPLVKAKDEDFSADHVFVTMGVWSKKILQQQGLSVPLERETGYHVEFINPNMAPKNPMTVMSGKYIISPMRGRIRAAGLVEFGNHLHRAAQPPLDMLKRSVRRYLPQLTYDHTEDWFGHRPALPDSLPILGSLTSSSKDQGKNLWGAFGHQHVGLTGSAKTGRILAQSIEGSPINMDLDAFRADRPFTPSTKR
ncbi:MAG: NAD(P)/FAD-dependent oxidoreductase [Alphaproteobacteria bacterium]